MSASIGGSSRRGSSASHNHHNKNYNNNNSLLTPDISGLTVSNVKGSTALPSSSSMSRQSPLRDRVPSTTTPPSPGNVGGNNARQPRPTTTPVLLPPRSVWRRLAVPEHRHRIVNQLLNSLGWKVILIICSIILLFGAPVRDLLPLLPELDLAIDVVFVLLLVILLIDVLLRCDAETDYFCCPHRGGGGGNHGNGGSGGCGGKKWKTGGGSFLFWCDLLSSLTLLNDITFIATHHFQEQHIRVTSIPGLSSFTDQSPVELEWTMLSLVFQTFRVARFIRSSRALKASSKMDWYSIVNICTPARWKKKKDNKKGQLFHEQGRSSDPLVGWRWSVLSISMLAAAKASSNDTNLNAPWWKRIFRRSTFDTEEFRQHVAAARYVFVCLHASFVCLILFNRVLLLLSFVIGQHSTRLEGGR
jgi:hypothetical protein